MTFELRHARVVRTILLSSVVIVGCAVHESDDADEAQVLRHEGHGATPAAKPASADAGPAVRDASVATAAPADCASTYDAIQATIFDNATYNCSSAACHGTAGGHVDLRKGFSYDNLLGVTEHVHDADAAHDESAEHVHQIARADALAVYHEDGDEAGEEGAHGAMAHVVAGQPEQSMLYDNLRAKLENTPTKLGGTPMPLVGPPVSKDQLEAVRLWIAAGAPETGFVAGTQAICPKLADAGN